jgi:hypothetical protein
MTSSALKEEIEANYATFDTQWPSEQQAAVAAIASQRKKFVGSYVRISSIQAWRTSVVQEAVDDDSLEAAPLDDVEDLCAPRGRHRQRRLKLLLLLGWPSRRPSGWLDAFAGWTGRS